MARLTDKRALVTGGSRGIGAAVAERLAAEGAAVAVNYAHSADAAKDVCERIADAGGTAFPVRGDVSDTEDAAGLVDEAVEKLGGALDIVVNNAGISRDGLLVRMSEEDFDDVLATNLRGAFLVSKAVARPMMKARGGCVVNISSVIGLVGNSGQANYAAAKAGLIGFTKSVARELAPRGVRCNAVAPGFIETAMTAELSESIREHALGDIAMDRFGDASEVASVVAFLASDEASYITGQVLAVDGGMTFA